MADTTLRDALTQIFENRAFAASTGARPFYADISKKTGNVVYNFGFGFNISANGTGPVQTAAQTAADANQLSQTSLQSLLSAFTALNSVMNANYTTAAQANAALDASVNSVLPQTQDWRPIATSVMDNYYDTVAIPDLDNQMTVSLATLPIEVQFGLEDLQYNTGGTFFGPILDAALSAGDYSSAAFELAVNTYNPNSSNGPLYRAMADAMLVLGFQPVIAGDNSISALNGQPDNQTVSSFLSKLATTVSTSHGTLHDYLSTAFLFGEQMLIALRDYTISHGFHVVQLNDTVSSIAALVNSINGIASGFSIDSATLQRINSVFTEGVGFSVGGIIHVPISATQISSAPASLPPLGVDQTFVFDPQNSMLYTVQSSINTRQTVGGKLVGFDAGQLIIDSSGTSVPASLISELFASSISVPPVTVPSLVVNLGPAGNPSTRLTFDTSGFGITVNAGSGLSSSASVKPINAIISGVSTVSTGGIKLNLSSQLGGQPLSLQSNSDGSFFAGIDPPDFVSVVNFANNGLNGSTEAISLNNGVAIFDTQIGNDATVEVSQDFSIPSTKAYYTFTEPSGELKFDNPIGVAGTIFGLMPGATLELTGISATHAALGANNVLTVPNGSGGSDIILPLDPTQTFTGVSFDVGPDGTGDTDVFLSSLVSLSGGPLSLIHPLNGDATALGPDDPNLHFYALGNEAALDGYLYVVTPPGLLRTVDIKTGQVVRSVTAPFGGFVADNLTKRLVGIYNNRPSVIDPVTGAVSPIGAVIPGLQGIALGSLAAANGIMYFVAPTSQGTTLFTVDLSSGTVIHSAPAAAGVYVADNLMGKLLKISNSGVSTVDPATGTLTQLGNSILSPGGTPLGVAAALDGRLYYEGLTSAQQRILNTVDIQSGALLSSVATTLTNIIANVTCFIEGTRIATPRGEIPVEKLSVGDVVDAHFAGQAKVTSILHRHVDCRRHPAPKKVWPVRVRAGAFGGEIPHRDLWLSPDHAVFVDNVLIPVKYLINDSTIAQVPVDEVTYHHVELARHDLLRAEGMLAESHLNTGSNSVSNFTNGGDTVRLHPDFATRAPDVAGIWETQGCAPLVITGHQLVTIRKRLEKCARLICVKMRKATGTKRKSAVVDDVEVVAARRRA